MNFVVHSRYRESDLTFLNGVFARCFKFLRSDMSLPGALDLDPGSQGKSMNAWYVSFETNVLVHCLIPVTAIICELTYPSLGSNRLCDIPFKY